MNVMLSENIRAFRKGKGMTQEQLAETLNVSLGVISKWELGLSTPEIGIVMEMADFFGTSVDVLLGYQLQSKSREKFLRELQEYLHNKAIPVSFLEIERNLKKFPNDFEVVYRCAELYEGKGTESQNQEQNLRALALYEQACRLIGQNREEHISLTSIKVNISQIYRSLGNAEKAVEILKENNPCGVKNALLGEILAMQGKTDEADSYLSQAMLDLVMNVYSITSGYMYTYITKGRYQEAIALFKWCRTIIEATKIPGKPTYADKLLSGYITIQAYVRLLMKQKDAARETLREAKALALRFDKSPSYAANTIRFAQINAATGYDDYGVTAMDGVERTVLEQENPEFAALWEKIKQEDG